MSSLETLQEVLRHLDVSLVHQILTGIQHKAVVTLLPELLCHTLCDSLVELSLIVNLVRSEESVVKLLAGHCIHIVLDLLDGQVPYRLHTFQFFFLDAEHGCAVSLIGEGLHDIHIQLIAGLLAQEEGLGLLVEHVHGDIGGVHLSVSLHHVGYYEITVLDLVAVLQAGILLVKLLLVFLFLLVVDGYIIIRYVVVRRDSQIKLGSQCYVESKIELLSTVEVILGLSVLNGKGLTDHCQLMLLDIIVQAIGYQFID